MPLPRYKLTHYTVLGVSRNASHDEVKAAYKVRAKTLHPDLNQHRDTTAEFQRLQTAYTVLSDPEQRADYDLVTFPPSEAAGIPPPSRPSPPRVSPLHVEPTARRPRGCLPVAVAIVVIGGGYLFFDPSSSSDSPTSGWVLPQPSSASVAAKLEQEMQATIVREAQNNYVPQTAPPAEVEMQGRDGRKHVVSSVSAKILEPARNKLFADSEELRERERALKIRHDNVELDRKQLSPSRRSEIEHFNEMVAALNRDNAQLNRDLEAHKKAIDAFFADLERETLRIP